uniref:BPI2 domain-containing protein n=1 Tax=Syphacia muris TaxID=451379 RepID=A0A0N5AHX1_9BILA
MLNVKDTGVSLDESGLSKVSCSFKPLELVIGHFLNGCSLRISANAVPSSFLPVDSKADYKVIYTVIADVISVNAVCA